MQRASAWRELRTEDGSVTLAHPLHGEACHSRSGAWSEALAVYARPCRVAERTAAGRLALLDVGTGLGTNVAAALAEAAGAGTPVELEVDTLEADPSVIERAVALGVEGQDAPGAVWRAAVLGALDRALARALAPGAAPGAFAPPVAFAAGSVRARLRLRTGDARDAALPSGRYDVVFLDLFSPATTPEAWAPDLLDRIAGSLAPGGVLATYCASTRVRAGLLAAGLAVGAGPAFGKKTEGTLASRGGGVPALDPRTRAKVLAAARELSGDGRETRAGFA